MTLFSFICSPPVHSATLCLCFRVNEFQPDEVLCFRKSSSTHERQLMIFNYFSSDSTLCFDIMQNDASTLSPGASLWVSGYQVGGSLTWQSTSGFCFASSYWVTRKSGIVGWHVFDAFKLYQGLFTIGMHEESIKYHESQKASHFRSISSRGNEVIVFSCAPLIKHEKFASISIKIFPSKFDFVLFFISLRKKKLKEPQSLHVCCVQAWIERSYLG